MAGLVKDVCKMAVCECGFPYSWAEKDPYKRAEKQCKMADMTKPKKFDGKMPEDIEKFFTDKTRVTQTENEVSRTLILGHSAYNHHINSDTVNCKDAMGITAVNTYGATRQDLFNRPMHERGCDSKDDVVVTQRHAAACI